LGTVIVEQEITETARGGERMNVTDITATNATLALSKTMGPEGSGRKTFRIGTR
jgi:hypothetical protein